MSTASTTSNNVCEYCGKELEVYEFECLGRKYKAIDACDCYGARIARGETDAASSMNRHDLMDARYAASGIGDMYRTASSKCSEYVSAVKSGRNVFIYGPNGSGKSTLAASIAKKLVDLGDDVLFVNACIAVKRMQASISGEPTDVFERMCSVPYLVIDDLGKGNPTEWDSSVWYAVAEARNMACLPTVVTTNYSGSELIVRLTAKGDDSTAKAIVSRFRGGAVVVKMDGTDRRVAS